MSDTNDTPEPVSYQSTKAPARDAVVARAATYYRMTRYIMVAVLFGYGIWSIRDGFSAWPKQVAEARAAGKDILPHSQMDIRFNQVLGVLLPPLSILMLVMSLRKSRGEIAINGETLTAPGHPPIPFDAITAVDQRLWDRKGIAYVDYDLGAQKGRITLDDFIYDRDPIDEIHDRLVKQIAPEVEESDTPAST